MLHTNMRSREKGIKDHTNSEMGELKEEEVNSFSPAATPLSSLSLCAKRDNTVYICSAGKVYSFL